MNIRRLSLLEGAKKATGLAVVIDVFRAFTTAAYATSNGAQRIYPVETVEEAFKLKEKHPDWILMGERDGKQVKGFDYGNSPYEIKEIDFTGKTIVQTTSAGTRGLFNAYKADEILAGSFVMADAIIDYIKQENPETLSLVAMGWGGLGKAPEDELLAAYIEERLTGGSPDFESMKAEIREDPQGAKFFEPDQSTFKEGDFHCAMDLNRFDFCLRLVKSEQPYLLRVDR